MRSYTNSDDMKIEISQEHLDIAVKIKKELQDSNYGRRCNWNEHKKMMELEGFFDSDINESYRCLIKDYQKEIGELQSVASYADYVAEGRLESIKQVVGEMYFAKADNQQVLKKLNTIKKDLTTSALCAEELRNVFLDDLVIDIPHYAYKPKLAESKNKGISIITDWHIGVKFDNVHGNSFSLEIAKKRINQLKQETLDYCRVFNITDLYVCNLGDAIEHLSMHENQSQYAEFPWTLQVKEVSKLIIDYLVSLSEYVNVHYEGIAGNHDRFNGNKKANFDGDNANVIVDDNIRTFIELTKSQRISMKPKLPNETEIKLDINGSKIKLIHGENENKNNDSKIKDHISMDEEIYDALICGHLHHYRTVEENNGRMTIYIGSLIGTNNYSKKHKCTSHASQGFILIREDGQIVPLRIDLQIV